MEEIIDPVNLITTNLKTGEEMLSGPYEREILEKWVKRTKRESANTSLDWRLEEIE